MAYSPSDDRSLVVLSTTSPSHSASSGPRPDHHLRRLNLVWLLAWGIGCDSARPDAIPATDAELADGPSDSGTDDFDARDAGSSHDTSGDAGTTAPTADASSDTGLPDREPPLPFREVNGCFEDIFFDQTVPVASRSIRWTFGVGQEPERCMRVRVGQNVTFVGDLSQHPLQQSDGEPYVPVGSHVNGVVHLTRTGIFGFVCGSHPGMRGVIWAVP